MSLNKKLQNQVAHYFFTREIQKVKRIRSSVSFKKAHTVGILYDATEERDYEIVKAYVKKIRDEWKKDVLALGFYNGQQLPPMRFSKLGMDFFTKKSVNWHYKPRHPMVNKFINLGFDILIDLSINKNLTLQYIFALTHAKFKIGRYDKKQAAIYDFMIKADEKITLIQLIEFINQYLNHIDDEKLQPA